VSPPAAWKGDGADDVSAASLDTADGACKLDMGVYRHNDASTGQTIGEILNSHGAHGESLDRERPAADGVDAQGRVDGQLAP
jgi:hypothetical protein